MSTLQFSLFFAALLIGYVLIHVRLVRFEAYLKEVSGLKPLNDRLKGVSDSIERIRIDRVEEHLTQLHDDLVGLLDQLGRLERTVHQDLAQVTVSAPQAAVAVPVPVVDVGGGSAGERVRALVETRLLQLGYGDLRIVSELDGVSSADRVDVRVEVLRDGMPSKGVVSVRNGSVVDVALRSAAQGFP